MSPSLKKKNKISSALESALKAAAMQQTGQGSIGNAAMTPTREPERMVTATLGTNDASKEVALTVPHYMVTDAIPHAVSRFLDICTIERGQEIETVVVLVNFKQKDEQEKPNECL